MRRKGKRDNRRNGAIGRNMEGIQAATLKDQKRGRSSVEAPE